MIIKTLLVAVDASALASVGASLAAQLSRRMRTSVCLLHVVDSILAMAPHSAAIDPEQLAPLQQDGHRLLDGLAQQFPNPAMVQKMILVGDPAETILSAACEAKADLLIMGTNGRTRLAHFPLGSVLDQVIRRCPCPVLVVPQRAAEARAAAV
jgi:nucleotide-binding universal stress UspA family protein